MTQLIVVPNVNIKLLYLQRNWLLNVIDDLDCDPDNKARVAFINEGHGLVNMLDEMLDLADGHTILISKLNT